MPIGIIEALDDQIASPSSYGDQSQNSPSRGSFAKSVPSWQRKIGTPLRSNCFIRIRLIDMPLVLQSKGIGIVASNPSR